MHLKHTFQEISTYEDTCDHFQIPEVSLMTPWESPIPPFTCLDLHQVLTILSSSFILSLFMFPLLHRCHHDPQSPIIVSPPVLPVPYLYRVIVKKT